MPTEYFFDLMQHSDAWHKARAGIITASIMKNLISKKTDKKTGEISYEVPNTEKSRAYLFQLASERMYPDLIDPFQSYAMERGVKDEVEAFRAYSEKYEQLRTCGFVKNDDHGVTLGYSPDGLTALNDDGQMECKSREPKFQIETIYYDEMPDDFTIQVQTGLIVSQRKWCDFVSYCGGAVMYRTRIEPDEVIQKAIIEAAVQAEAQIQQIVSRCQDNIKKYGFIPTIKRIEDIAA